MILYFFLFVLGIIIGSFLNVVICRTHQQKSIIFGRSQCPVCQHQLHWYELVPVFSFLALKGVCRHCDAVISKQYVLVELATALLFVAITHYASSVSLILSGDWNAVVLWLRNLLVICVFIVIFVYDLQWQLILDRFTLPAIAVVIVANILAGTSVPSMLIAIAVGGGFFLLQYRLSRGRWIGGGDIRLGALIGAVVGWPVVIVTLFLSYIIGAITLSPLLLTGKAHLKMMVPFGTFLVVGALISMMWGQHIADWYLSLL